MTSAIQRAATALAVAGVAGCFGNGGTPPTQVTPNGSTVDASTTGADASVPETGALEAAADAPSGTRDASAADAPTGIALDAACAGDGASVLPNGQVLVAGGWNATNQTLTSAEIYDPTAGTFSPTGSMTDAHLWAGWTAPWPVVNGSVLAAGGLASTGALLGSAETYSPTTGRFSPTGPLGTPVIAFDLVTLQAGAVLFIGGYSTVVVAPPTPGWQYTAGTDQTQLYDPTQGTFSTTAGPLGEERLFGCNVVLPSGDVVAIGGWQGAPASFEQNIEEYDPGTGQWSTVGELGDDVTCSDAAFVLPSGAIFVDGANLLDPSTWTTTAVANPITTTSTMFVQLAGGDVLAIGGKDASGDVIAAAQRFDATASQWTTVGSLHQPRTGGRALLLTSGDVLVVGGSDATGAALATAEVFHP